MANYVDKGEMIDALIASKEDGRVSPVLAKMFMDIATGYVKTHKFMRYSQDMKDDLVAEALKNCVTYYRTFDTSAKTSPLSYFTRACENSFYAVLKRHYNQRNIEQRLAEDAHVYDTEEEREYDY